MSGQEASLSLPPESLKARFVVGLLFPLHIILGISLVPITIYLLACGNMYAWVLALLYLPWFSYPAHTRFPGWKGAEGMWRWFDYAQTCRSYFGAFEVHGGQDVDPTAQYIMS